jgi:hypothetical protein
VAAVLTAMLVLPGIASAHEATLTGKASECRDAEGAFTIDWTLTSEAPSNRELDGFDDSGYDPGQGGGSESVDQGTIDVVDGGVAPNLTLGDFGINADGIHGNGSANAQTAYDGSLEPNETIYAQGRVQWTSTSGTSTFAEQNVRSNDIARPDYCREDFNICVDGGFTEGDYPVNEAPPTGTNDCDPVRICDDGQSMTVTEYVANNNPDLQDADPGSCVPSENPPPPPPTTEEEPEEPVEEVEEAVAEVSPVVEEVAALPAAGYGTTDGSGIAWAAILGLALIGIGGGATVLIARRS